MIIKSLSGKRTNEQYPKSRNFRGRGTTIMITIKELYEKAKAMVVKTIKFSCSVKIKEVLILGP